MPRPGPPERSTRPFVAPCTTGPRGGCSAPFSVAGSVSSRGAPRVRGAHLAAAPSRGRRMLRILTHRLEVAIPRPTRDTVPPSRPSSPGACSPPCFASHDSASSPWRSASGGAATAPGSSGAARSRTSRRCGRSRRSSARSCSKGLAEGAGGPQRAAPCRLPSRRWGVCRSVLRFSSPRPAWTTASGRAAHSSPGLGMR